MVNQMGQWSTANNKPESWLSRLDDRMGDRLEGAIYRASRDAPRDVRDEVAGWESAPGGRTSSSKPLTRKEKRAADKILRNAPKVPRKKR